MQRKNFRRFLCLLLVLCLLLCVCALAAEPEEADNAPTEKATSAEDTQSGGAFAWWMLLVAAGIMALGGGVLHLTTGSTSRYEKKYQDNLSQAEKKKKK